MHVLAHVVVDISQDFVLLVKLGRAVLVGFLDLGIRSPWLLMRLLMGCVFLLSASRLALVRFYIAFGVCCALILLWYFPFPLQMNRPEEIEEINRQKDEMRIARTISEEHQQGILLNRGTLAANGEFVRDPVTGEVEVRVLFVPPNNCKYLVADSSLAAEFGDGTPRIDLRAFVLPIPRCGFTMAEDSQQALLARGIALVPNHGFLYNPSSRRVEMRALRALSPGDPVLASDCELALEYSRERGFDPSILATFVLPIVALRVSSEL